VPLKPHTTDELICACDRNQTLSDGQPGQIGKGILA